MRNIMWISAALALLATVNCQDSSDVKEVEPDKKIETKHLLVKETMETKPEEKVTPKEVGEPEKEEKTAMAEEEKPKTVEKPADEPVKKVEETEAKTTKDTVAVTDKISPQTSTSASEASTTALPKILSEKTQTRSKPETKIPKTENQDVPEDDKKTDDAPLNPETPKPRLHPRKKAAAPKPVAEPEVPEKETKKEEKEGEKTEAKELPKIDPTTPTPMKPMQFIRNKNLAPRIPTNRLLADNPSRPTVATEPTEETAAPETPKQAKPIEGVRTEIRSPHPLSHKPLRRNTRMLTGRDVPQHMQIPRGNRQQRPLRRDIARQVPVAKSQHRNPRRQLREERKPVMMTPPAPIVPQIPSNSIIVMKNGRIVPLTQQQQIDLDLIISSMVRTRRRSRFYQM